MDQTNITNQDLADAVRASAMLVDCHVKMWSGEITDHKVTNKIKSDANACGRVGNFKKILLSGTETPLKTCKSAFAAVRQRHYELTTQWGSAGHGPRLLSSGLSMRYMQEVGALRKYAFEQRDVFCAVYDQLVEAAKVNLGSLANELDYPDLDQIRRAFDVNLTFDPIPDKASFPNLPSGMLEKLSKTVAARQSKAAALAHANVWRQVREQLEHLHRVLADPNIKFKSASLLNVRSLADLLPGFNMFGDHRLEEIANQITQCLDNITAQELRDNKSLRMELAHDLGRLVSQLDDWGV